MDINADYVVRALIVNAAFLASLGLVMTCIVKLLVKQPEESRVGTAVLWSTLVVISFVWLWGVAYMNFPSVDELINNVFNKDVVASSTYCAVNVDVNQPESAEKQEEIPAEDKAESESEEEEERLWGEGTPRGPRGHLDNR